MGTQWLLWLAVAWSAPEIEVRDDGAVFATEVMAAQADDVRALLSDAEALAALSPEVRKIETTQRGRCQEVATETRGLLRPLRLRSLRCPTTDGFREELMEVGDFSAYEVEWAVRDADGGARIEYSVRVVPELAVPSALVQQGVERSTRTLFENIARTLLPGKR